MRKILLVILGVALACGSSGGDGTGNNHSPFAGPAAANPTLVMGQSTQLLARAADPDGDALTYSWTQTSPTSPQGTFSSTTAESPTWTAPTVEATTPFTLTVEVSDGKGGSVTATVTVYAKISTDPSFVAEVSKILDKSCAECHGGAAPAARLALEANRSYAALVDVPATSSCTSELRVKPGDADHSVLIQKMTGASCGDRMPLRDPTYYDRAPGELALVRTWIENGAPDN